MPAHARSRIVDELNVGVYHCVNRCVRRAFLCGQDAASGRNFDHRKVWIRQRLETLAGLFAIDVFGFAVMANHLHLVLRNRPDVAADWSDEEVSRRWCALFPRQHTAAENAAAATAMNAAGAGLAMQMLREQMLLADPDRLAECRRRLSSLSWLMRCLCEPIARAGNREDHVTGRFWEGRFKCQALLDEAAVLACSLYVDLNPIRAGLADTPETSFFTSACERIADRQAGVDATGISGWLSPIPTADVPGQALVIRGPVIRDGATRDDVSQDDVSAASIASRIFAALARRLPAVAGLDGPAGSGRLLRSDSR